MKSTGPGLIVRLVQSATTLILCLALCGVFVSPSFAAIQSTASGTYTYSPGIVSFNLTNSNFMCDGPSFPTDDYTVTSITDTEMIWQDGPSNTYSWYRSSGVADNITGTWSMTNSDTGNFYTLVFNPDKTVSVNASINQCQVNGTPTIDSFSPASGIPGNLITISGSNFSPILTDNTVMFNGVPAVVTDVQASKIFVIVPVGATTGTISVTNAGGTASSSSHFTVDPGTTAAILNRGGVHHRIDSDGLMYDALDAGISSYTNSLTGMTLTVSGPGGKLHLYRRGHRSISPWPVGCGQQATSDTRHTPPTGRLYLHSG